MKTYAIGDLHGRFQPVRDFHSRHHTDREYNKADKYLILLGDSGLNYYLDSRDKTFKKKLSKYPFTYFVVRGNHEERTSILAQRNPDAWYCEKFWGSDVLVEKDFPYIKYALDCPNVYEIPYRTEGESEIKEYRTLVIPGAYSVDKNYRLLMGFSWFENEQLTEEEKDFGLTIIEDMNYKCDLILSHTCPCCFEPTDLFLPFINQAMVDKSMERYLGQIEFMMDYSCWMWGHYHAFRDYPRTDGKKKIMLYHDVVNLNQVMNDDVVEVM